MSNCPERDEFLTLMRQWEREPLHVLHVASLAVQLFDGLASLHQLAERDRLMLEAAAILHDIGHTIQSVLKEHHKESARLIRENSWRHFQTDEVDLIAQTARYHRKGLPELGHKSYARLSPDEQRRVKILAALLRIADGLDRQHAQLVLTVRAEFDSERIALHLITHEIASKEIASATMKSDLAEAVFGRKVFFTAELTPRQ